MDNTQLILEKIEKNSRKQLLFTRLLCIFCVAILVCSLILMVAVTGTAKQLAELAKPLQEITAQVQDMTAQAETVMNNMETVTQELADADLGTMVKNVNALAAESQTVVSEAMKKLDTIDIDTLNKAIKDLSDVVEPLAKIPRLFG